MDNYSEASTGLMLLLEKYSDQERAVQQHHQDNLLLIMNVVDPKKNQQ